MLEIIVLSAADARAAASGGADRVELVSAMEVGGLSPSPATVAAVRAEIGIPARVMLRRDPGFAAPGPAELRRMVRDLRAAGAEAFVLGFLDDRGDVDRRALDVVLDELDGAPWTFHRAIDHAADRAAAWRALDGLPGLDAVLTAGSPDGITDGLATLIEEAGDPRLLAGGGLRAEHIGPLRAAGVTAFHTSTAVRVEGAIDAAVVRHVRTLLTE
ncbi:copper homeostasis protein CutC [Dactylosporangium sp. AC04546]|uniref:copper homeostasis protein CutC n=1 Tax=Dactylosporangium sp. AC04546 TaxID=2862460 RepID=UPI001EE12DDF|nr:copper homeostasis protein CutC [Dactylosporangium sp. AC04546]WVK87624.1 copper homeostasis protein CutC [Dactylosporangium sp. AC04546]